MKQNTKTLLIIRIHFIVIWITKVILFSQEFVFFQSSNQVIDGFISFFLNKIGEEKHKTIACKNNRLPNIRNNITTKSTFFMLLWNACEWWRRFFGMQKIVNKERIAFYSEKCMRKNLIKSWLCTRNPHKCVPFLYRFVRPFINFKFTSQFWLLLPMA